MNKNFTPQLEINLKNNIGEGALWHLKKKCLYWIDIPNGQIFQYFPKSKLLKSWKYDFQIGGFSINNDGKLLLFMQEGRISLWDDGKFEDIIKSLPYVKNNRFNDVIADPVGRVFCGIMSTKEKKGSLFRLNLDNSLTIVIEKTGTSNGMGFNKNQTKFYFCDSMDCTVSEFDYDKSTGDIFNRKIIFVTDFDTMGRPDGMCVDIQDNLWIALWKGWGIIKINSKGKLLKKIKMPVRKVTNVCFAGENYNDMYINSAGYENKKLNGDLSGSLFKIKSFFSGKKEFLSKIKKI